MAIGIRLRIAIFFFLLVFAAGAIGYKNLAVTECSWIDASYMTIITLTTVGFNEVVELDDTGRIFTMALLVVGIGIIMYVISAITAFIVDGNLRRLLGRKKMQKALDRLQNHHIICGAGATGVHIIEELMRTGRNFVIIDTDEERIQKIRKLDENMLYLVGDASNDDLLIQAGIKRACGMVVALPTDKDNLFVTITARQLNPRLRIVTREVETKAKRKLIQSGANSVVSPNMIGGLRMVSELLRPSVVSFLDVMLRDTRAIRFEEAKVPDTSPLIGKKLRDAQIHQKTDLLIVAIRKADSNEFIYNPGPDLIVEPQMTLIVLGESKNLDRLKALMGIKVEPCCES